MATPISAATFWGELKDHVPVRAYTGWQTRNRGKRGAGWGPVHGVGIHHFGPYSTVAGAVAYARDRGGPDLPPPLYSMLVDRQGVVHLLGWGRTNHAGPADPYVMAALVREDPLPRPLSPRALERAGGELVDGNAHLYGLCLLNKGDKVQAYTKQQLDSAAVVSALLVRGHRADRWTERSVLGHREWQYGKVDPSYDMGAFRRRVRDMLALGVPDLRGGRTLAPAPCGCTVRCAHEHAA